MDVSMHAIVKNDISCIPLMGLDRSVHGCGEANLIDGPSAIWFILVQDGCAIA